MDAYTTTSTRPKPKTMAGTTNKEEGDKGEDEDEDETGLETHQMHLEPVCHVKKGPNNAFCVIWVIRTCFFILFLYYTNFSYS